MEQDRRRYDCNYRYWDKDTEIFEDHLTPETLRQYEERELEKAINKYGRYPGPSEKSPYYGQGHNGPATLSLNRPRGISKGARRLARLGPKVLPKPYKVSCPPPKGDSTRPMLFTRDDSRWRAGLFGGLDQPQPEEKDDYNYWLKWSESLPFRWESFRPDEKVIPGYVNKLELWRAKKGWKWWLAHYVQLDNREEKDNYIYLEPFTKPALVHFSQRGIFSSDAPEPRRAASRIIKEMERNAELRWEGVPLNDKERRDDANKLRDRIWVEGIRDHYGFLGHALCNASSEIHSSVKVLFVMLAVIWGILFCFGPISLANILSELMVGVIPAQNALGGILAMKADAEKRETGDDWTLGGNARQWLVYFPFYQLTSMLVGWIYISRPTWYWWAIAWRTTVLLACGSPYFGEFNYHAKRNRLQKIRVTRELWLTRGKKRQNEVILRPSVRDIKIRANFLLKMRTTDQKPDKGANPEQGNPVEFTMEGHAAELQKRAMGMLGFLEEYAQLEAPGGLVNKKSGTSKAESLKACMKKIDDEIAEMKRSNKTAFEIMQERKEAEAKGEIYKEDQAYKKPKFEAYKDVEKAIKDLEGQILRAYAMMRTTPGGHGLRKMFKDRYGATDEEITHYLEAFNDEVGLRMSREQGIDKAFRHDTLHEQWENTELGGELGMKPEDIKDKHRPWEREYKHNELPRKYPLPDVSESVRATQRGESDFWSQYRADGTINPDYAEHKRAWENEVRNSAPELWDPDMYNPQIRQLRDMPWSSKYTPRVVEDINKDEEVRGEDPDYQSGGKTFYQRRPRGPNPPLRRWMVASEERRDAQLDANGDTIWNPNTGQHYPLQRRGNTGGAIPFGDHEPT